MDFLNAQKLGVDFTYNLDKDFYYPAFIFPTDLGELKHIYQNNNKAFDLLDFFTKKVIMVDENTYYKYRFNDKIASSGDKFTFLWTER